MQHSAPGIAQPKTDPVKRAMEILKDRPMPQPITRQNSHSIKPTYKPTSNI
jgi:hypothetical protein